jgi:hypothetical protein
MRIERVKVGSGREQAQVEEESGRGRIRSRKNHGEEDHVEEIRK